ncbi:hypothetical protein V1477_008792 [Vespula maculifrons]|uniref:Uncharacterized protein n=1 Tax=Vespula maculifrons TaxID=7453 RepID=A0ABD2CE03_VESMC
MSSLKQLRDTERPRSRTFPRMRARTCNAEGGYLWASIHGKRKCATECIQESIVPAGICDSTPVTQDALYPKELVPEPTSLAVVPRSFCVSLERQAAVVETSQRHGGTYNEVNPDRSRPEALASSPICRIDSQNRRVLHILYGCGAKTPELGADVRRLGLMDESSGKWCGMVGLRNVQTAVPVARNMSPEYHSHQIETGLCIGLTLCISRGNNFPGGGPVSSQRCSNSSSRSSKTVHHQSSVSRLFHETSVVFQSLLRATTRNDIVL